MTKLNWPSIVERVNALRVLGMTQKQACAKVGVCPKSMRNWIRRHNQPKVERVTPPLTDLEIAFIREWKMGTKQGKICARLGIDENRIDPMVKKLKLHPRRTGVNERLDWESLDARIVEMRDAGRTAQQTADVVGISLNAVRERLRVMRVIEALPTQRDVFAEARAGWIEGGGAGPAIMRAVREFRA